MRQKTCLTWLVPLGCFVGFAIVSILVASGKTMAFDNMIASWVHSFKSDTLLMLSQLLAKIGEPRVVLTSAIVVSIFGITAAATLRVTKVKTAVANSALLVAVNLFAFMSEPLLKSLFQRPRPLPNISSYSFPSGHALLAFAFCITGAYLISRHISSRVGRYLVFTVAIIFIVLMGLSRIYLSMHYATDIIAGFFISGFILSLLVLLCRRFAEFR